MKIKRTLYLILILLLLVVSLSTYAVGYKYIAQVNNAKILLESAVSPQERQTGLMYRNTLKQGAGMLFIFEKSDFVNFWMKNVKIPLDIVFISDGKVVKLYNNVKACYQDNCPIYPSMVPVDRVIEVNAGFCAKHKIKEGQAVKFYPLK